MCRGVCRLRRRPLEQLARRFSACVFALDGACFSVFSDWKCVTKDQKCEKAVVLNGGTLELSVAAACFRKAPTTAAWSSIDILSRIAGGIVFSGTAPARLPSSARYVVPGLAVRRIEVIGPCSVALLSSFHRSWCWPCFRRRWRCVPGSASWYCGRLLGQRFYFC